MNDSRDPRAKLLAETLQGDWANGPVSAMARRAAAHARQHRRVRHRLAAAGATVGLALVLFLFAPRTSAPPPHVRAPEPVPLARGYDIISDDELVALLRDRPLLVLPQENGAKTIVLLGH
ncbi:MAG: hypothetical protein HY736_10070 [Verrucomicrobia bacterium]|nr:hypothetical protein [Verrucomicrobiota bacterium]